MQLEGGDVGIVVLQGIASQLDEGLCIRKMPAEMLLGNPKRVGRAKWFRFSQRPIVEFVEEDAFSSEVDEEVLAIM